MQHMAKTQLSEYIANDLKKQKGISVPVRASLLERLLIKNAPCSKLHPNAEDEFSMESVGPSYEIINEYEKSFREAMWMEKRVFGEPLLVEKLRPDGFLLLNGHHRWAAAMRCQIKKVPIKIINCATESDIRKLLERSRHDKRVAIDLDEVVFRPSDYEYLEKKANTFPMSLRFNKRIRLGIPALFYFLSKNGYDIWLYASDYYSIDDVRKFFRAYSARVDGIITGYGKRQNKTESEIQMEKLIFNKYSTTLHIDNDLVIETHCNTKEFEEYEINSSEEDWSRKVIAIVEEIEKRADKNRTGKDAGIVRSR